MRALVIDATAKGGIDRVRQYAEGHPYFVGDDPPGDNDNHTISIGDYRCVFSITRTGHRNLRHLSVSVPGDKYPHPAAVFMIADEFGFTGWSRENPSNPGADWIVGPNPAERCVVVAQDHQEGPLQ